MIKLEIKNYNMILTQRQEKYRHYYPKKFDKYEYLRGEEILPPYQKRVAEKAKYAYCPLGKASEKQTKTMKNK